MDFFFFLIPDLVHRESGRTKPSKTFTPDLVLPNLKSNYEVKNVAFCISPRPTWKCYSKGRKMHTKITRFTIISSYIYKKESTHQIIYIFIKQSIQKNLYIKQSIHQKELEVYQVGSSWVTICMSFIIDVGSDKFRPFFSHLIYFFIGVGSDIFIKQ